MPLRYLAYTCALIPTITVHITLFIAVLGDNLHPCLPYWSHCHSISATGRQYPEFFVFKGLMIPTATLMLVYWTLQYRWLSRMQGIKKGCSTIFTLGITASTALIIYTLTLGAAGEPYALARRIGVILFFAFTAFAHLLLAVRLKKSKLPDPRLSQATEQLYMVCMLLIGIGLLSSLLGFFWDGYQYWDNAFEWWFAALMMMQFYCAGKLWRYSDYRANDSLKQ